MNNNTFFSTLLMIIENIEQLVDERYWTLYDSIARNTE